MTGIPFEITPKQAKKSKALMIDDRAQVTFLLILGRTDKRRYEQAAKALGFSTNKFFRVAGTMLDLLASKKVSDFNVAYQQALSTEEEEMRLDKL